MFDTVVNAETCGVQVKESESSQYFEMMEKHQIDDLIAETNRNYTKLRLSIFILSTMDWYKMYGFPTSYAFVKSVLNMHEKNIGKQLNRATAEFIVSQGDLDFIGTVKDYHLDLLHQYIPPNIEKDIRKRSEPYVTYLTDAWRFLVTELGDYGPSWTGRKIQELLLARLKEICPDIQNVYTKTSKPKGDEVEDSADYDWDDDFDPDERLPEHEKERERSEQAAKVEAKDSASAKTLELPQSSSSSELRDADYESFRNWLISWLSDEDKEDLTASLVKEILVQDTCDIRTLLHEYRQTISVEDYKEKILSSLEKRAKSKTKSPKKAA